MQGSNSMIGIALVLVAVAAAVVVGVLLLRWRVVRSGQPKVPPPVDSGSAPEKARDVHQEDEN